MTHLHPCPTKFKNNGEDWHPEQLISKMAKKSGRHRDLFSQTFKPIITARRQVIMKRIACTIGGVEMLISVNMRGKAEVIFIKTFVTGEGGCGCGYPRWHWNINWLGSAHVFVVANNRTELCSRDQGLRID